MSVRGEGSVPELCKEHILLDEEKRALPDRENVKKYDEVYQQYLGLRKEIYHV
jgi:hypothetical protein